MKYKKIENEKLILECSPPLSGMFQLSPFVWLENGEYQILMRAVNPSEDPAQKVARIYSGTSKDGLHFKMSEGPVIAPSTKPYDKDGCEDPTVVCIGKKYLVYYTGWNQTKMEGQLILAKGDALDQLKSSGIVLGSKSPYINPKEATVSQLKNGKWQLLFEYANNKRSKLGVATSESAEGPWKIKGEYLPAAKDSWDNYHLSPGPVVITPQGNMILFYNGSDDQAKWRIGWAELDEKGKVTARSKKPLIVPPKSKKGESDIAFAASAVLVKEAIWLYYTTADKTTYRAIISIHSS